MRNSEVYENSCTSEFLVLRRRLRALCEMCQKLTHVAFEFLNTEISRI